MRVENCNNINFTSLSGVAEKAGNAIRNGYAKLPEVRMDGKTLEKFSKLSNFISNPVGNRLVLAGTGILLQPTIDYYNKKVDRKTREVSAVRTASKIIAGTAVGLVVRGACLAISKNPKFIPEMIKGNADKIKNFQIAFSTIMAMGAMTITNFLLDAPLTTKLSNAWLAKREQKEVNKK